jgi:hypothetical protein
LKNKNRHQYDVDNKEIKMEQKTKSIKKTARIVGILTLLIVVFAPFSMIDVPFTLVASGEFARNPKCH